MLIIFTGEKDEKKLTSKQNLFVEIKKKKKKRKSGGKTIAECGQAHLLFSVLYLRK